MRHLPPEGALARALADDGLTVAERLAMMQLDFTALHAEISFEIVRVLYAANTSAGTQVPEALKMPRALKPPPQPEAPPARGVSLIEAMGMSERMFNG